MTNEEAIRILESMKSEMLLVFDHDRKEALKLAITALRAQNVPDTNVGDTISRQAAIDEIERWEKIQMINVNEKYEGCMYDCTYHNGANGCRRRLEAYGDDYCVGEAVCAIEWDGYGKCETCYQKNNKGIIPCVYGGL